MKNLSSYFKKVLKIMIKKETNEESRNYHNTTHDNDFVLLNYARNTGIPISSSFQ